MINKDDEVVFDKFLELEINKRIKNHKFKQPSKLKNINILKEFKILIEKQILDLNNKLNFYKKELEHKLISSTTFFENEKETTNELSKLLQVEIASLKIEEINEEQTKEMEAISNSTSGYKPSSPKM